MDLYFLEIIYKTYKNLYFDNLEIACVFIQIILSFLHDYILVHLFFALGYNEQW